MPRVETPPINTFLPQPNPTATPAEFSWPLDNSQERQKLLSFGMYVTPDPSENPISPPERFTGYHSGLDIEILPGEENRQVLVKTICSGNISYTGSVSGYGGVIIQRCVYRDELVTVLYGHINPDSFIVEVGDKIIPPGTVIAELSPAYSPQSGYTRKHLHVGIHKGDHRELKGYVQNKADLDSFIDPLSVLRT